VEERNVSRMREDRGRGRKKGSYTKKSFEIGKGIRFIESKEPREGGQNGTTNFPRFLVSFFDLRKEEGYCWRET